MRVANSIYNCKDETETKIDGGVSGSDGSSDYDGKSGSGGNADFGDRSDSGGKSGSEVIRLQRSGMVV